MAVDPGQLLDAIVASLAKLFKLSERRPKLDLGFFKKVLVLGDLESKALTLFGDVLANFLELGFVLGLHLLHLGLEFGYFVVLGPEEGELIVLLLQLGLMLSCLFEKMQHHIRHGHTILKRC